MSGGGTAVKHQPARMCRVCRMRLPKSQLQRWLKTEAGFEADPKQAGQARGVYTCSPECAAKLALMKDKGCKR